MAHDIQFNVEDVRRTGADLADNAERLRSDIDAFAARLEGFGNPFGDDDLGATMRSMYDAVHQRAMESLQDNTSVITDSAEQLGAMADEYAEIDAVNGDEFAKILGELAP